MQDTQYRVVKTEFASASSSAQSRVISVTLPCEPWLESNYVKPDAAKIKSIKTSREYRAREHEKRRQKRLAERRARQ